MKSLSFLSGFVVAALLLFASCGVTYVSPPPEFIVVKTFYKTPSGADLLNSGTQGSFSKDFIKVWSVVDRNNEVVTVDYSDNSYGGVIGDVATGFNCLQIGIPTNYSKKPLKTIVRLSETRTDTITYTFEPTQFKNTADKIFYNGVAVWDIRNTQANSNWPTITIIP